MWGKEAKPVLKGANGRTKEDISWVKGIQPDRYLAVKLKKYDDCKDAQKKPQSLPKLSHFGYLLRLLNQAEIEKGNQ